MAYYMPCASTWRSQDTRRFWSLCPTLRWCFLYLGGRELAGDSPVSISCRPQGHQGRGVCEVSSFGRCWFFCVYVLFCVCTVYLKSGPHAAQPFYPLSHLPSLRYVLPNHFGILEFYSLIPVHQLSSSVKL